MEHVVGPCDVKGNLPVRFILMCLKPECCWVVKVMGGLIVGGGVVFGGCCQRLGDLLID